MQALIDTDILLYEVGYKSQMKDKETGEIIPLSWEEAMKKMDDSIAQICADIYATEPPILYITGEGNFRDTIATERPYKGNRKSDKPFHYHNLKAYVKAAYDCRWEDGLEADDLIAIEQYRRLDKLDSCVCSRDKDLRIIPGMSYSWEVRGQPRFGPTRIAPIGTLQLKGGGKKIFGTGLRFFYAQCLMGDKVDNIPGIKFYGPVKAFNTLKECKTKGELEKAVREAYREAYGDEGDTKLLERGRMLWMTEELNEDGSPVLWEIEDEQAS